jgi:hypothetical protein
MRNDAHGPAHRNAANHTEHGATERALHGALNGAGRDAPKDEASGCTTSDTGCEGHARKAHASTGLDGTPN